jgi:hypothetical protein
MIRARGRALLILLIAALACVALAFTVTRREAARPGLAGQRPPLLLLTSLPLMFGDDFSLAGNGSAALRRLQSRYRVVPISVSSASQLARGRLLLMAQPPAQTPENLVALDNWVRGGGRVLLLADPLLEWPSKHPLGDVLRPPPMFADTGLLMHWGIQLEAPDRRGLVLLGGGHDPVAFVSPGRLVATHSGCVLSRANIVADCKIARGRAIVVADADFLNPSTATLRNPTIDNTNELMELLETVAA